MRGEKVVEVAAWSFPRLLELVLDLVSIYHVHTLVSVMEMICVTCTLSCNVATI